jgi:hypothetical protein
MPIRRSHTAVLEKNSTFTSDFATEPYEVAWATEARWFIRLFECEGNQPDLHLQVQVSPDGLEWCNVPGELTLDRPGLYTLVVAQFGHWLRLNGTLHGEDVRIRTQILLALKE